LDTVEQGGWTWVGQRRIRGWTWVEYGMHCPTPPRQPPLHPALPCAAPPCPAPHLALPCALWGMVQCGTHCKDICSGHAARSYYHTASEPDPTITAIPRCSQAACLVRGCHLQRSDAAGPVPLGRRRWATCGWLPGGWLPSLFGTAGQTRWR